MNDAGFAGTAITYVKTGDGHADFPDDVHRQYSGHLSASGNINRFELVGVRDDSVQHGRCRSTRRPYSSVAVGGSNPLFDIEQQLDLAAPPSANPAYFYNARGYGEKYLISNNGSNAEQGSYYILLPNGNLYGWDNNSVPTTLSSGFFVANVGTAAYNDPTLITAAQPAYNPIAYNLQQMYQLTSAGPNYIQDARNGQEKYFAESDERHVLRPDAQWQFVCLGQ